MDKINSKSHHFSIIDSPGSYNDILSIDYQVIMDASVEANIPVEIFIPTYKRPRLLFETIDSAMNQQGEFEYLITVIDNDPESLNLELINNVKYKNKIRYIRNNENVGMFGNWNRAIQLTRQPFFVLLHDDDLLEHYYISTVIKIITLYPDLGVLTHTPKLMFDDQIVSPFNNLIMKLKKNTIGTLDWQYLLNSGLTSSSSMLISREKSINIGGWSTLEYPSSDWFFNARMAYNYSVLKIYMAISIRRYGVNAGQNKNIGLLSSFQELRFILSNYTKLRNSLNSLILFNLLFRINKLGRVDKFDWLLNFYAVEIANLKRFYILSLFNNIYRYAHRAIHFILWMLQSKKI